MRVAASRGFSLIELLVVIGIILLLVALTVGVQQAIVSGSEVREAENTLRLLDAALQDWEKSSERQITFGVPGFVNGVNYQYDIPQPNFDNPDDPDEEPLLISVVLHLINRNQQTKDLLAKIDPDYLFQEDNTPSPVPLSGDKRWVVRDPWDQRIMVVFPGREWRSTDPIELCDADGTLRTEQELRYGICVNRRICFVSGGPDGMLGDLHLDQQYNALSGNDLNEAKQAEDNLYSYELLKERLP